MALGHLLAETVPGAFYGKLVLIPMGDFSYDYGYNERVPTVRRGRMGLKKISVFLAAFLLGLVATGSANEIEIDVRGSVYNQAGEQVLDFRQIPLRIKALIEAIPSQIENESDEDYSARIQPYENKLRNLQAPEYNIILTPEQFSFRQDAEYFRFVLQFPFPVYRKDGFISTQTLEYIYKVSYDDMRTLGGAVYDMKIKLYFKILGDNTVSVRKAVLLLNNKRMHQWE